MHVWTADVCCGCMMTAGSGAAVGTGAPRMPVTRVVFGSAAVTTVGFEHVDTVGSSLSPVSTGVRGVSS